MRIQAKDLKLQKRNNRFVNINMKLEFDLNQENYILIFQVATKKKEEGKKGSGAKDDKGEKKGKEDEEDLGYKLTSSEFVKQLKTADKTFVGEIKCIQIFLAIKLRKYLF